MKTPATNPLSPCLKRRRALPRAATATALGLASFAMLSSCVAPVGKPNVQEASKKVKDYTADVELALDKVDRERLRAAAEKTPATIQVKTATAGEAGGVAPSPKPVAAGTPSADGTSGLATIPTASPPAVAEVSEPAGKGAGEKPTPDTAPQAVVTFAAHATPTPTPHDTPEAAITPKAVVRSVEQAAGGTAAFHVAPTPTNAAAGVPADPPNTGAAPAVGPRPSAGDAASPMAVLVASPLLFPETGSPISGVSIASTGDSPIPGGFAISNAPAAPPASAMVAMSTANVQQTPEATAASPESSLTDALTVLRKNVGDHPTLSTALALALLDNKSAESGGDLIKSLAPADQKLATELLSALSAMKPAGPNATVSDRAGPLVDAITRLREDADLSLPRMVLATRVDSFGVFTETPSTFEQGKRHTVIIYCEVANFGSQKDGEWYSTRLTQQETLITEDGLLVWRPNPEDIEDRSRNQRHDFYLVKKLTLPETLAAGKYTLRMTVTDKNKNKTAVINRPLEIVLK